MKNTFVIMSGVIGIVIILTMMMVGFTKENLVIQADSIVPAVTETSYSVNATEAAELLYDYYN